MIAFEEAYRIVMNSVVSTGTEKIRFEDSLNRILREEVRSDTDMPPFDKATVDGFAIRKQDIENELEIVETIPAGSVPRKHIGKNQCSRIMTGAPVPEGADCVLMVEDTIVLPSGRLKFRGTFTKENIAFRAEDVRKGDAVLEPGRKIKPQDIAVMASVGHTRVEVSRKPVTGIISSGSELVEPGELPGLSQIRNSNSYQLMAQAERAGADGKYYGIARDDEEATYSVLLRALAECDLVLISGGVSMGDFDFVPKVLERAGVRLLFTRVAVQPGKPTTFGVHEKALLFGLPGNPVSSFMIFELITRPLISRMMGFDWTPRQISLPMKSTFTRRFSERMSLIPVIITEDGMAQAVDYHGSAHITALPHSYGIISLPAGVTRVEKGEKVIVRQI
ncbi:MAG: molybdopterin molybdotransferase MoeA [Bacteroidales bacterium]|jgi:molybdopterin molybdotransferase|nr:molybdopterin molybdotransferase MoeA [Bacteroidales bacterium]